MVPLYSGAYGKTSIGTWRGCRAGRPGKVPENNRSVFRIKDSNPPLFPTTTAHWSRGHRWPDLVCVHTTQKNRNKLVRGRHRLVPLHPPP